MSKEIITYLKYANIQMASEAQFGLQNQPPGAIFSGAMRAGDLTNGNGRSSRFTDATASDFSQKWTVVEHKSDTTTGFSGTLFQARENDPTQGIVAGELVLSFRSTEFADDAVRDNQATNALEIKEHGWAFGQIDDMQDWYTSLKSSGKIPAGQQLTVTGYSLGGHLATAFKMLNPADVQAVYTFNGAGVGQVSAGTLAQVISTFDQLRNGGSLDRFSHPVARDLYLELQTSINGQASTADITSAITRVIQARSNPAADATAQAELDLLSDALGNALSVRAEVDRVAGITNSSGGGNPVQVAATNIDATKLNYQLAVLQAAKLTSAWRTGEVELAYDTVHNSRATAGPLANVYDIYGATFPSAVSNSQFHYGQGVPVWIEDQPLVRGNVVFATLLQTALYSDVKLLVDNFGQNDFGDTHSLVLLVDSLTVQSALARLDPTASATTLASLMKAASAQTASRLPTLGQGQAEGDVLENVVNMLDRLLGTERAPLKGSNVGGTWADIRDRPDGSSGRNSLQERIHQITDSDTFKALEGKVTIASTHAASPDMAHKDFAAFISLLTGTTFSLRATDSADAPAVEAAFQGAFPDVYADWQADLAAIAAAATQETLHYTDAYLNDRSALLNWRGIANSRDEAFVNSASAPADRSYEYHWKEAGDNTEHTMIVSRSQGPGSAAVQVIAFGGEDADELVGNANTRWGDRLYGGGGGDTLKGLAGNDYLEGNAGNDTLESGSGMDTLLGGTGFDTYVVAGTQGSTAAIIDADRSGSIQWRGHVLGGGKVLESKHVWQSEDGTLYHLDGDLEEGGTLTVDGRLTVSDFRNGDLGITLTDSEPPPIGEPESPFLIPVRHTHVIEERTDRISHGDGEFPGGSMQRTMSLEWMTMQDAIATIGSANTTAYALLEYASANDEPNYVDMAAAPARHLNLLGGDDVVQVKPLPGSGRIASIDGGAGKDTFNISDGVVADLMAGGAGNDFLNGSDATTKLVLYGDFGPSSRSTQAPANVGMWFELGPSQWIFHSPGMSYSESGMAESSYSNSFMAFYPEEGHVTKGSTAYSALTFSGESVNASLSNWTYNWQEEEVMTLEGRLTWPALDARGALILSPIGGIAKSATTVHISERTPHPTDIDWWSDWRYVFHSLDDYEYSSVGVIAPELRVDDPLEALEKIIGAGEGSTEFNDLLLGGEADDIIYGQQGSDSLLGGAGNDFLILDEIPHLHQIGLDDRLTALEKLLGKPGDDFADGGGGHDDIRDDIAGSDALFGGAGSDLLVNVETHGLDQVYSNLLDGGEGDDSLDSTNPTQGTDVLRGGEGYDTLRQWVGAALMEGGEGNDYLWCGDANMSAQRLDGGQGVDTMRGSGGDDVYVVDDDGDVVIERAGEGIDTVEAAISYRLPDDVENLILTGNATAALGNQLDNILVGNALDNWIDGGEGDDILQGGGGSDLFAFDLGDGHDVIVDMDGSDRVQFGTGIVEGLSSAHRVRDSLILRLNSGADQVVVQDYFVADGIAGVISFSGGSVWDASTLASVGELLEGTNSDDALVGGFTNDVLEGAGGDDVLDGGPGDDVLAGGTYDIVNGRFKGSGNDTYRFGRGDGKDIVYDDDAIQGNKDVISFKAGIAPGDIEVFREIDTLVLKIAGSSDAIRVAGFFEVASTWMIEEVRFADAPGTVWSIADIKNMAPAGQDSDDTLVGTAGPDWLDGGIGNDNISGLAGDDSLIGGMGSDVLQGGIGSDTFDGGEGDDLLAGGILEWAVSSIGNDTYRFGRGDGRDTVHEFDSTPGNLDSIEFKSGVSPADVEVACEADTLVLRIAGTEDAIRLNNFFANWTAAFKVEEIRFTDSPGTVWTGADIEAHLRTGTEGDDNLIGFGGNDSLYGGAGNDYLQGRGGNDDLDGGVGNDFLAGGYGYAGYWDGAGNDTYRFGRGDGQDKVVDGDLSLDNKDIIVFKTGVRVADVKLVRDGDSLELRIIGTSDTLRVEDYFQEGGAWLVEEVHFADAPGTVWTAAIVKAKLLTGTDGDDMLIGYGGNDVIAGHAGNDSLQGGHGDDVLDGGPGDDALAGGISTDYGSQGVGNDTYQFGRGDGHDIIYDDDWTSGNTDTIVFKAGVAPGDVQVTKEGRTLVLKITGTNDTLRVNEYFYEYSNRFQVEEVRFADAPGTIWTFSNIHDKANNIFNGTAKADTVSGSACNDVIDGKAGADTMSGGVGDDTYVVDNVGDKVIEHAGEGIDNVTATVTYTLYADVENLTLIGEKSVHGMGNWADNVIVGNVNANKLVGGDGNDTLIGSGGADALNGDAGRDRLVINQDNISKLSRLKLDGGAGRDTLALDETVASYTVNLIKADTMLISGLEMFDITGGGSNTLLMNVRDLISIHDEGQSFVVTGDASSSLHLANDAGVYKGAWSSAGTQVLEGVTYNAWVNAAASSDVLLVGQAVTVSLV